MPPVAVWQAAGLASQHWLTVLIHLIDSMLCHMASLLYYYFCCPTACSTTAAAWLACCRSR